MIRRNLKFLILSLFLIILGLNLFICQEDDLDLSIEGTHIKNWFKFLIFREIIF